MSLDLDNKLDMAKIMASPNVAELLSDDDLDKVGDYVHEGYTTDKDSRATWEEQVDDWVRLALQVAEPKSHPWPGAANVTYPLITTAALQFSARAYPSLLPGTNPVRGRVVGYDTEGTKTDRALRVGKHMSYQILEEMEDWEEEMASFYRTDVEIPRGTGAEDAIAEHRQIPPAHDAQFAKREVI